MSRTRRRARGAGRSGRPVRGEVLGEVLRIATRADVGFARRRGPGELRAEELLEDVRHERRGRGDAFGYRRGDIRGFGRGDVRDVANVISASSVAFSGVAFSRGRCSAASSGVPGPIKTLVGDGSIVFAGNAGAGVVSPAGSAKKKPSSLLFSFPSAGAWARYRAARPSWSRRASRAWL